jgi:hypothetical protein
MGSCEIPTKYHWKKNKNKNKKYIYVNGFKLYANRKAHQIITVSKVPS